MRLIARLVAAILTLVLVAMAGLFLLPSERIAQIAADRFETATGRALTIRGEVRPMVYPRLGVRVADVEVSNAPWAGETPMLRAQALSVGVALGELLRGTVRVEELRFLSPRIELVRDNAGRGNWRLEGAVPSRNVASDPASGTAAERDVPSIAIDLAQISDAEVRFEDQATGRQVILTGANATLRLPDAGGTAQLTLDGRLDGQDLATSAEIDRFAAFLSGEVQRITTEIDLAGGSFRFAGRAGLAPLAADGQITARADALPAVLTLMGQETGDLPVRRVGLDTRFTLAPEGSVHLRAASLELDENTMTGEADLYFDGKPKLRARLAGTVLDLGALGLAFDGAGPSSTAASATQTGSSGWPRANLNAGFLSGLDGELALRFDGVSMGKLRLGSTDIVARLNRARLVFDIRGVEAFAGDISGNFVVNNRSGLSVGGDLVFADLSMQPFLSAVAGYDRLIGTGTAGIKFLGSGPSVDAIMRSLSGSGRIGIGKGALEGFDLAGMIRNLDTGFQGPGQRTIFDKITAAFTIDSGVLSNGDLDFRSPFVQATGQGTVDLGKQTLDYRVIPVAFQDPEGTGGLAVPVDITGPWNAPQFRPDLTAALGADLQEQAANAEAAAKARLAAEKRKVKERIANELGVDLDAVETADDLEDALKQQIDDGVKNLLGLE